MAPRRFKPECKHRAVEEWVWGGKRIAEICRKYQLSDSLVRKWRKQYEAKGPSAWDAPSEHHGERTAADWLSPTVNEPNRLRLLFELTAG
jgi:transposase-like protein